MLCTGHLLCIKSLSLPPGISHLSQFNLSFQYGNWKEKLVGDVPKVTQRKIGLEVCLITVQNTVLSQAVSSR